VMQVWSSGGVGLVAGWSLGWSFGVIHRWLALGMVVVGVVHCDCRARCGCRGCGSSCRLLFKFLVATCRFKDTG